MLDLNQGIYEHFLRRREDNSTFRYWLLAGRGLWEDVPEDGDKNKFQPSASAECAGRTTNLHHHQEGSSGVEKTACSGGHFAVLRNQRKVPGEHVADRRNFVVRLSTEAIKNNIQLYFEVILLDANTSSTDEVSSVSDTVHLELFSDFARRRHVHHTSDFVHVRFSWDLFVRSSFAKKRGTPSAVDCIAATTERTEFAVTRSSPFEDKGRLLTVLNVLKARMRELTPLLWRKCTKISWLRTSLTIMVTEYRCSRSS